MVQTKTVILLNVNTQGAGQPDYAQPQSLASTEQTLIVKYPESEISANRYDDFAQIIATATQVEYIVGTNANLTKIGSWESGVLAKSISFYSSADILVRFNFADAVQHEVPAELLKVFTKRVEKVYIQAKNGSATVKMWIEG